MAAVCSICLSSFKSSGPGTVALNCGHVFHRDCINQWLYRNDSRALQRKECPSCRRLIEKPRSLKELFLHFDAGDMTLMEDDISRSERTPRCSRNQLSNVEAQTVETLQCQLESCQIALTESINAQNNLESERNNLEAETLRLKENIEAKNIETHRLKLINDGLRTRTQKAVAEASRLKNSKILLTTEGHNIETELEKYEKSESPEVALKTLATVIISLKESLEKEKKASKMERTLVSALNLKISQLNAKNLDLEKENKKLKTSSEKDSEVGNLNKCPIGAISHANSSDFAKIDENKAEMVKRNEFGLNLKIVDLTSENEDEDKISSSSDPSSSIASRLHRRKTLPISPEIGNPSRKILRPRQTEDTDMKIRPAKMVFRVSKRNSIKLKTSDRIVNGVKK